MVEREQIGGKRAFALGSRFWSLDCKAHNAPVRRANVYCASPHVSRDWDWEIVFIDALFVRPESPRLR